MSVEATGFSVCGALENEYPAAVLYSMGMNELAATSRSPPLDDLLAHPPSHHPSAFVLACFFPGISTVLASKWFRVHAVFAARTLHIS